MTTWKVTWRRLEYKDGESRDVEGGATVTADSVHLDNGALVFIEQQRGAPVMVAAFSEGVWDYVTQEATPYPDEAHKPKFTHDL